MVIEDNGQGFSLENVRLRPSPGLGLDSIEGRLRIIDGKIQYETAPEKGCRAIVELKNFAAEKAK